MHLAIAHRHFKFYVTIDQAQVLKEYGQYCVNDSNPSRKDAVCDEKIAFGNGACIARQNKEK